MARWTRPGGENPAIWNMIDSLNANANLASSSSVPPIATSSLRPSPTPPPPPAMTPSCTNTRRSGLHDDYHIEIIDMTGNVIREGSHQLYHTESGCGILNSWTWTTAPNGLSANVTFNQPLGMKGGCVERAFISAAGGPQIAPCSSG